MRLDLIPSTEAAPADATPSLVRRLIPNPPVSRRTLVKGLVVSAIAATVVPFEWFLSRRAANAGPTSEWTASNCSDGYPGGYGEGYNNWWSDGRAVCFGGWRMGSYPCSGGFHFEGWRGYDDEGYTSSRVTTCSGRNAWRWTAYSTLYRCSDANTFVRWNDGDSYTGLTIAMCRV
ncbi:hypothetical protein [Streptosporangium sp. NPDC000396]|uniref:hypothetical protein n=1 Tax=Streptosporangium sp. NPDC000396 TaxID=3366185 RepID=UPI0036B22120